MNLIELVNELIECDKHATLEIMKSTFEHGTQYLTQEEKEAYIIIQKHFASK